ncbi:hypothetical protein [Nonomuraea roseola]|uniref:DivIVA domain-containing protein n=1 Tax=Nonomuraea roseola TaxID=46179 RepID=A0ABV5Q2B2_9ACTN
MLVVLAIAALAILACVVVVSLGRGGELTEFPPDVPPLDLPEAGQLTAVDFMALQLPVNLVGYHTQSVDETLRRAANAISARDTRIAVLEQRVSELLASRLQARQEAYAGSSVTPRTEHRPDAPTMALPEDGSPASQPYARVVHQPAGDDTEAGQQQSAPEDFDGPADETVDPGQNGQARTDTFSAATSDESSVSSVTLDESSMDADREASAEVEAVRSREGTADSGTVAPTWGRTAPSAEDGHTDSNGVVDPHVPAEHPETRAHGAGADAEAPAHDAGDDGDEAWDRDAAHTHDASVDSETHADGWAPAHDAGDDGDEARVRDAAQAHGTGVDGEDRVHDAGHEGGEVRAREVGAEGSNGAGELPASIGRSRDGRA